MRKKKSINPSYSCCQIYIISLHPTFFRCHLQVYRKPNFACNSKIPSLLHYQCHSVTVCRFILYFIHSTFDDDVLLAQRRPRSGLSLNVAFRKTLKPQPLHFRPTTVILVLFFHSASMCYFFDVVSFSLNSHLLILFPSYKIRRKVCLFVVAIQPKAGSL